MAVSRERSTALISADPPPGRPLRSILEQHAFGGQLCPYSIGGREVPALARGKTLGDTGLDCGRVQRALLAAFEPFRRALVQQAQKLAAGEKARLGCSLFRGVLGL